VTPLPNGSNRPLRLEEVWLVAAGSKGPHAVPGISVVADGRGFNILGPQPGAERIVLWNQMTAFSCHRPARLPDGSPATVLEIGLANGRTLELLLPVSRVPPSETLVVEAELAAMAERYGKEIAAQQEAQKPAQPAQSEAQRPAQSEAQKPARSILAAPVEEMPADTRQHVTAGARTAFYSTPVATPSNGSSNGAVSGSPRTNGSPRPATERSAPASPEAPPAPARPAPPVKAETPATETAPASTAPISTAPTSTAPTSEGAHGSGPANSGVKVSAPAPPRPPAPSRAPAASRAPAPAQTGNTKGEKSEDEESVVAEEPKSGETAQDRESRLLRRIVVLIGVVVAILAVEVVLVLFVLNNNSKPTQRSGAPIPALIQTSRPTASITL